MSFDPDFGAQLNEMAERGAAMDTICERVGRDPGTLRRSANLFDARARAEGGRIRYYDDDELFVQLVQDLSSVGVTDIGLYYPSVADQMPSFERIGRDVLPALRAEQPG